MNMTPYEFVTSTWGIGASGICLLQIVLGIDYQSHANSTVNKILQLGLSIQD